MSGVPRHRVAGRCRQVRTPRGFTLIETLVTLTILALLTGWAAQGFKQTLDRRRLESAVSDFRASVQLARAAAIKAGFNARVTLAPNESGQWRSGWAVFVDASDNAAGGVAPSGNVLLRVPALPVGVQIDVSGLAAYPYLSFIGNGDALLAPAHASVADRTAYPAGLQHGWVRFSIGNEVRVVCIQRPGRATPAASTAFCG